VAALLGKGPAMHFEKEGTFWSVLTKSGG
jgi:hypothetical protein